MAKRAKVYHTAETESRVQPDLVDVSVYGYHTNFVRNRYGRMVRIWQFEKKRGRDKFLEDVPTGKFYRAVGPVPPEPCTEGIT